MQMGADVVALKVPRPGRRREGFGRALAKEANMLCGLRHRNVLGCFGVMRWGRVLVRCDDQGLAAGFHLGVLPGCDCRA